LRGKTATLGLRATVSGLGPVLWRRETGKEEGRDRSALNPQGIAEERNHVLVGNKPELIGLHGTALATWSKKPSVKARVSRLYSGGKLKARRRGIAPSASG